MLDIADFMKSFSMNVSTLADRDDACEYNFMVAASRQMREAESNFGGDCINSIIEEILKPETDGASARILLDSLTRLLPSRQAAYERYLGQSQPDWRQLLNCSPQDPMPNSFDLASRSAASVDIQVSPQLVEAVAKSTSSIHPDTIKSAYKLIERIASKDLLWILRKDLNTTGTQRTVSAIISASRLTPLDRSLATQVIGIMHDKSRPLDERLAACECLMTSGELRDEAVSHIEELIAGEGDPSPFFDILLDIPSPKLTRLLAVHLDGVSLQSLPRKTLDRISRSHFLSQPTKENASLISINRQELDFQSSLTSGRYGLLVHRNSSASGAWVGHAGIFVSEDEVIDCSTGRDPNAVRKISFTKWRDGNECWGARKDDDHHVDLQKAVERAHKVNSWRSEYDGSHNNQKGRWFSPWFGGPKYWEADCVGFTEDCYERAGGDPTPSDFETGSGWPLTVREQRDHMKKVMDC
jgi:hypothetical protein